MLKWRGMRRRERRKRERERDVGEHTVFAQRDGKNQQFIFVDVI